MKVMKNYAEDEDEDSEDEDGSDESEEYYQAETYIFPR